MNAARDELIVRLHQRGYTQTQIARQVGMTTTCVKYAIDRIGGIPRKRSDPLLAICALPVAQADPDPNPEIIGNAGGGELPLPMTPGDGIGPVGALPPDFLLPVGPQSGRDRTRRVLAIGRPPLMQSYFFINNDVPLCIVIGSLSCIPVIAFIYVAESAQSNDRNLWMSLGEVA
jgi:hypothetical protein